MKSPHDLAVEQFKMSEEYSKYGGELAKLKKKAAEYFNLNRNNGLHKSDLSVKKAWDVTPDGVNMTIVEIKLDTLSKSMTAIRALLDVLTNEAKGLY
jgi:hypothetical protein